jgi:hypothetical protein
MSADPHHDPNVFKTALDWHRQARDAYRRAAAIGAAGAVSGLTPRQFEEMQFWQRKGDEATKAAAAIPLAKEIGR